MDEEKKIKQSEENEDIVEIQIEDTKVEQEEVVEYIKVELPEETVIEFEESFGVSSSPNGITHYGLLDRNDPNQHKIAAIEGLGGILNTLSSNKDVYSIHGGYAEFQEWKSDGIYKNEVYKEIDNGPDVTYNNTGGVGFFVSLVTETGKINGGNLRIDICKKIHNDGTVEVTDVYGVTVDGSGFCGNQADEYDLLDARSQNKASNPNYAKVCLLGNVKVRITEKEHADVNIGDYVLPNSLGYASVRPSEKEDKYQIGFKVISKGQIESVGNATTAWYYVEIALVPQNDNIARVMKKIEDTQANLENITIRLDTTSDKITNIETDIENSKIQLGKDFDGLKDLVNESTNKIDTQLPQMKQELQEAVEEVVSEANKTIGNMTLEYAEAVSKANEAKEAIYGTDGNGGILNDIKNLQDNMEPLAEWKGQDGSQGVAAFVAQANEDRTQLATLTSAFGPNGSDFTAIIQKIDENGAAIQHLVSHVDKYILGEYSPAYKLSYDETVIIKPDTIYVPTKDHSEEYAVEDGDPITVECTFGKSYKWQIVENTDTYMWTEYKDVSTSTEEFDGKADGDLWYCWQGVFDNSGTRYSYGPQILYCWDADKKLWVAVASINDNSTARVTGLIRQTADELMSVYTDLEGNVSSISQTVDGIESEVENVKGEITKIEQTAEEITLGTYKPGEGSTSLGILLNGMQAISNYGGRIRIKYAIDDNLSITENRYTQAPMWDGEQFVFTESNLDKDGDYYPYSELKDGELQYDNTKYCKVVSGGYEVYTIGNEATALLRTDVDNNKSVIEGLTKFETDTTEALAVIRAQADANSAQISSITEGEYVVCIDIKLDLKENELSKIPTTRYNNPPTWKDNGFVFDEKDKDDNGKYCMFTDDTQHYYKLLFDANHKITGYEQYELESVGYAEIVQMVTKNGSSVGMIVDDNGVKGGVVVEAINNQSEATIKADKVRIDGFTSFTNSDNLSDWMATIDSSVISKTEVEYISWDYSDAEHAPPKDAKGWSTGTPVWQPGKYIWQRTVTYYEDSKKDPLISDVACIQGAKGEAGISGVGIKNIEKFYCVTREFTCPTPIANTLNAAIGYNGGINSITVTYAKSTTLAIPIMWSTYLGYVEQLDKGEYLWTRTIIDYEDDDIDDTIIYTYSKADGNGEWSELGRFDTSYTVTFIQYQGGDSDKEPPNGNWYDDINEVRTGIYLWTKTYLDGGGLAYGIAQTDRAELWFTTAPPTDSVYQYLWGCEKINYTDGTIDILAPTPLQTYAEDGRGTTGVTNYYYATQNEDDTLPSTEGLGYDSDTGTSDESAWCTNVAGLINPFNETNKYLWNCEVVYYSDGTSHTTEPAMIGVYSKDGLGISSIEEFYCVSAQNTCECPDEATLNKADECGKEVWAGHWYKTAPLTNAINKYLWNCERITYTDGSYVIFNPALIGTYGNSITQTIEYYTATTTNEAPYRYDGKGNILAIWVTDIAQTGQGETKPYVWNFERVEYTMDSPKDTEVTLLTSTPRVIETITEYYATTTTGDSPDSRPIFKEDNSDHNLEPYIPDTWKDTEPLVTQGDFLWNCEVIKYTAVDSNGANLYEITPLARIGYAGIDGKNGADGKTPVKGVDYFDGTNGKDGTSIVWKGSSATAPTDPQNGWAYYNTEAKASYVYQDGGWYQMSIDGVNGQDGVDGLSIVWKGELVEAPEDPQVNWVYKDTDDGKIYIYNGTGWELMVLDGSDGKDGTDGKDGLSVFITYNDSVSKPTTDPEDGNKNGWHTNATTDSVWIKQKVAADANSGTWGEAIKIKGTDGQNGTGIKKINTHLRKFTLANWKKYGKVGHEENWSTLTGYDNSHINVGDIAYVVGVVTDAVGVGYTSIIDKPYLWSYEKITYNSGSPTITDPCIISQHGAGIYNIVEWYAVSKNNTNAPAISAIDNTNWSSTFISPTKDAPYLWHYEEIQYPDEREMKTTTPTVIATYGDSRSITSVENWYLTSDLPNGITKSNINEYTWSQTPDLVFVDATIYGTVIQRVQNHIRMSSTHLIMSGGDGRSTIGVMNYYYATSSDDVTKLPAIGDNAWKTEVSQLNPPFNETNKYLWNYETVDYSYGENNITSPTLIGVYSKDGDPGRGINDIVEYYIATEKDTPPTELPTLDDSKKWTKDGPDVKLPQTSADQPYLWNYEIIDYTIGDYATSGPVIIGTYGNSIKSITEYYTSTSTTSAPERYVDDQPGKIGTWWSESIKATAPDPIVPYVWNFERIEYTMGEYKDTEVTLLTSTPRAIEEITEYYMVATENMTPEPPTYANTDTHNSMKPIPTGWKTTKPSVAQGQSLWNCEVIKYTAVDSNGKNLYEIVPPAIIGYAGTDGATGRSITSVTNYYYATQTDTESLPDKSDTNTWKTQVSDLVNSFNETYKYLWNYEKVSYSSAPTEDTTEPTIIGVYSKDGDPGKGINEIVEYYIVTSNTDIPQTTDLSKWTKVDQGVSLPQTSDTYPYLWNYEIIDYTIGEDTASGPVIIGTYGNGIKSTTEYYTATATNSAPSRYSSGMTINTDVWKANITDIGHSETKPYVWNFERVEYTLSGDKDTDVTLLTSTPRSIDTITEYYMIKTDGSSPTSPSHEDINHNKIPTIPSGWSTTRPAVAQGQSLWNCEVIKYTAVDSNGQNLYDIVAPARIGYVGKDGSAGRSVTGVTNYYYAINSDDKSKLPSKDDAKWKTRVSDLTNAFNETNKYLWNYEKVSYSTGDPDYTDSTIIGIYSKDGAAGRGVNAIVEYYKVTNTATPPNALPTLNDSNGWTKGGTNASLPTTSATNPYLWNYEIIDYTEGTDTTSGPVLIGTYGNSIKTTTEYYTATATNSVPNRYLGETTINTNIWKTNISAIGQSEKKPYVWNFERVEYTIDGPKDTEVTLLTSTPRVIETVTEYYQILPQNAEEPDSPSYDDASCNVLGDLGDWSTDSPGAVPQGNFLWNCEIIKYTAVDSNGNNLYYIGTPARIGYAGKDGKGIDQVEEFYCLNNDKNKTPGDYDWGTDILTPTKQKKYLWNYEKTTYTNGDTTETDPIIIAIYTEDGKSIGGIINYYLISDKSEGVNISDYGWDETPPVTNTTKKYLWNYEEVYNTSGGLINTTEPRVIGVHGEAGVGINSVTITYGISDSATTKPADNQWKSTIPEVAEDKYLWTRTIIDYTDANKADTVTYTYAKQGKTGSSGTSVTVEKIEYLAGESATDVPKGNWSADVVEVSEGQYLWTKTTFSDKSVAYGVAKQGVSGTLIEYVYYLSDKETKPATPKYDGEKLTTGWSKTPQGVSTTHKYEFMSLRTKNGAEWSDFSDPIMWSKWGEKGQDGDGVEYKYYRSNSSNSPVYKNTDTNWTDDPQGVSETNQYEYVVQIKTIKNDPINTSAKKINTNPRDNFTLADWKKYGTPGHQENWTIQKDGNYVNTHIKVGDVAYVQGTVKDGTKDNGDPVDARIYGKVISTKESTSSSDGSITMITTGLVLDGEGGITATVVSNVSLWAKWGEKGDPGVGISKVVNYYMVSARDSNVIAGEDGEGEYADEKWCEDAGETSFSQISESKPYLWNYEKVFYNNETSTSTSATLIGTYSKDGDEGRGIASIEEFYCISSKTSCTTPTKNTLDNAANSGTTANTWYKTTPPTTSTNKYLWNCEMITYTKADNNGKNYEIFPPALIGTHGAKGDTGRGISQVVEKYLATSESSGITTATSGWQDTIPTIDATKKYLWNYEQIIYDSGDPTMTDPVIIATYTEDGRSVGSVVNYYLASSKSTGVLKSEITYITPQATSTTNKYLWNYEKVLDTKNNLISETDPCIIGVHGEKGDEGNSIKTVITTYSASQENIPKWIALETDTYRGSAIVGGVASYNLKIQDTVMLRITNTTTGQYVYIIAIVKEISNDLVVAPTGLLESGAGIKKINTNSRNFTLATWKSYGTPGTSTDWAAICSQNTHINVGDTAYIVGTVSDKIGIDGKAIEAMLYGTVTKKYDDDVNDSADYITMTATCLIMGGEKGDPGSPGESGRNIVQITPQYYQSTSKTELKGGEWLDSEPTWVKNKYIWTRNKITWDKPDADGNTVSYTPAEFDRTKHILNLTTLAGENDETYIDGGMIATKTLGATEVFTNTLCSLDYVPPTDGTIFSQDGTSFNLSDGSITSKSFAIDADGNATIAGKITATSGYIGDGNKGFTIGVPTILKLVADQNFIDTAATKVVYPYYEYKNKFYYTMYSLALVGGYEDQLIQLTDTIIFNIGDGSVDVYDANQNHKCSLDPLSVLDTLDKPISTKGIKLSMQPNGIIDDIYYLGNNQITYDGSVLPSGVNKYDAGVYIGPDGIGLGNGNFSVSSSGNIHAQSGYIGDDIDGFIIAPKSLSNRQATYQGDGTGDPGVYIGSEGIGLGNGKFSVDSKGNVKLGGNITWSEIDDIWDEVGTASSDAATAKQGTEALGKGTYKGTFINGKTIYSPTIQTAQLYSPEIYGEQLVLETSNKSNTSIYNNLCLTPTSMYLTNAYGDKDATKFYLDLGQDASNSSIKMRLGSGSTTYGAQALNIEKYENEIRIGTYVNEDSNGKLTDFAGMIIKPATGEVTLTGSVQAVAVFG